MLNGLCKWLELNMKIRIAASAKYFWKDNIHPSILWTTHPSIFNSACPISQLLSRLTLSEPTGLPTTHRRWIAEHIHNTRATIHTNGSFRNCNEGNIFFMDYWKQWEYTGHSSKNRETIHTQHRLAWAKILTRNLLIVTQPATNYRYAAMLHRQVFFMLNSCTWSCSE